MSCHIVNAATDFQKFALYLANIVQWMFQSLSEQEEFPESSR